MASIRRDGCSIVTLLSFIRKLALSVLGGAVLALSLVTLIGVIAGEALIYIVPQHILKKGAAFAFILVGLVMFFGKW